MDGLRKLIVGIDFSPRSLSAAQTAVALAEPAGAKVELVHVVETQLSNSDVKVLGKSRSELTSLFLNEAKTALDSFSGQLGFPNLRKTVTTGSPAPKLARLCDTRNADLLVVGDTGTGSPVQPRGVGVNTYRLVECGPRRVLVVKAGHCGRIRSVAAAISFVPVAHDVLRQAHLIARLSGADLHVVRAVPDITELQFHLAFLQSDVDRIMSDSVHYNEKRLADFVRRHDIHDVVLKTAVMPGKPGRVLVDYLQNEDIDVVVLGTGTSYRIAGYPVGSTTHKVLNETLSSVCVVRPLEAPPHKT